MNNLNKESLQKIEQLNDAESTNIYIPDNNNNNNQERRPNLISFNSNLWRKFK